MHELAVADNIVNAVLAEMQRRGLSSVATVAVRVGALTDIVPDALEFGFEILTRETALAATKLKIDRIPCQGRCRDCGKDFEVQECVFVCPHCQSCDIQMTRGNELDIAYIEVDDGS
ncbi:MAG: hydrogenase maturation nickel metallochaperone HypA [Candidatus Zixiibacteriota bacterium]